MEQTEPMIIAQVEVFERGATAGSYTRRGVFTLDTGGCVELERDPSADQSVGLCAMLEDGVAARDPHGRVVLSSEGDAFLDAVARHFASATYFRVRRTEFPLVPEDAPDRLRDAVVNASALVRAARDLSARAMETDTKLAAAIEVHTRQIEEMRDGLMAAIAAGDSKSEGV